MKKNRPRPVRRPVVIEIDAGLNIPTMRHFGQRIVRRHGGSIIRVNPREPHIGDLPGVAIVGSALETLGAIDVHVSSCTLIEQPDP